MTEVSKEVEKLFDELVSKGQVVETVAEPTVWPLRYYEARAFGTDENGKKATICGHTGLTSKEAIDELRAAMVFRSQDYPYFQLESICVYECRRSEVY